MKKAISAYTITELLVVLLISMLVATCILQLFTYTNMHTAGLLKQQESQRQAIRCITYLKLNTKRSESIRYDNERLVFSYPSNRHRYLSLTPDLVITQSGLPDTLNLLFVATDTLNLANGNLLLMSVCLQTEQKNYSTTLYKQYQRDYLINQLERHEHFFEPATR